MGFRHDMAMLFFGAGLISWFSVEAAILSRLRTLTRYLRGSAALLVSDGAAFVGGNAYLAANMAR